MKTHQHKNPKKISNNKPLNTGIFGWSRLKVVIGLALICSMLDGRAFAGVVLEAFGAVAYHAFPSKSEHRPLV